MGAASVVGRGHVARPSHFVRHLVEMTLAMMVGMMVSAGVLLTALGMSADEALRLHAVLFVVAEAFGMTVAMVGCATAVTRGEAAPRWPRRWSSPRSC